MLSKYLGLQKYTIYCNYHFPNIQKIKWHCYKTLYVGIVLHCLSHVLLSRSQRIIPLRSLKPFVDLKIMLWVKEKTFKRCHHRVSDSKYTILSSSCKWVNCLLYYLRTFENNIFWMKWELHGITERTMNGSSSRNNSTINFCFCY